jgi:hypothetical protein
MEIYVKIISFEDLKVEIFFLWGWRKNLLEKGLKMGTVFYPRPAETLSQNFLLK